MPGERDGPGDDARGRDLLTARCVVVRRVGVEVPRSRRRRRVASRRWRRRSSRAARRPRASGDTERPYPSPRTSDISRSSYAIEESVLVAWTKRAQPSAGDRERFASLRRARAGADEANLASSRGGIARGASRRGPARSSGDLIVDRLDAEAIQARLAALPTCFRESQQFTGPMTSEVDFRRENYLLHSPYSRRARP